MSVYRIIRNFVNIFQHLRNWLAKCSGNRLMLAAPVPFLYEDDIIDEQMYSDDTYIEEIDTSTESKSICYYDSQNNSYLSIAPFKAVKYLRNAVFDYVEFPAESVLRIPISANISINGESLSIDYTATGSSNDSDVEEEQFIDDEIF
uniref:CPXV017 protein n=1 Tax=Rhabditophanes sp. KR3021 TaxID=114890 RepID=A0AC35U1J2_9BILA